MGAPHEHQGQSALCLLTSTDPTIGRGDVTPASRFARPSEAVCVAYLPARTLRIRIDASARYERGYTLGSTCL